MKQPLFIRIYSDDRLQGIKQFAVEQIVIGTSENAQLLLESDTVSPVHAVIEERDTGYYISDLGSTLGTLVNSESIIDKKLESGDFIQVGEFNLEFFIGIPKPSSPPKVGLDDVVPPVGLVGGESTATAEELPTLVSEDHIEAGESADKPLEEPASPTLATSHESLGGSEKETQEKQERVTPPIPQAPIDSQEQKSEQEPKLSSDHIPQQSVIHLKKPSEVGKAPIKLHRDGPKVPKPPQAASYSKKKKIGGTFAPPGAIKNLDEVIRPGKGTVVEVLVAWNQRVIATHHFHEPKTYTIGPNANADITIPIRTASGSSSAFLKLGSETSILLGSNPSGMWVGENGQMSFADLRKQNRLVDTKKGTEVKLQQGEMIRWDLENGLLSIYVRFKPDTVKPIVAPFLDFTTTEFTGIVLAGVITAILGLYMLVYSPVDMEEEALLEVPIRRAVVRFNRPKEKKVVKIDSSPKEKKVVKVDMKKSSTKQTPTTTVKKDPGKAAALKKTESKKKSTRPTSIVNKGGAKKTGAKSGSNAKSQKKDVSKMGLLNVFGNKGINDKLSESYTGSGGLAGMADQATGASGFNTNRAGKNAGGRFNNTGASGSGFATEGISGAGTTGRGTGGMGTGVGGLGSKGRVDINLGGQEAEVTGSIDREAIRRVIIKNKRQIKACYDRALNRDKDLYGKLVIEWHIEEKGIVTKARVKSSSLGNDSVGDCIVRKLRTWRFPEPPKDQVAEVAYPFVFQTQ